LGSEALGDIAASCPADIHLYRATRRSKKRNTPRPTVWKKKKKTKRLTGTEKKGSVRFKKLGNNKS